MELREVIERVLPHYEKAVIEMPKEGHYEYLSYNSMTSGICMFCYSRLKISIYKAIEEERGTVHHIKGGCPLPSSSYKQNLEQIQNRIDWMKDYLL